MRKNVSKCTLLLLTLLGAVPVSAEPLPAPIGFGVGAVFGDPTGLSLSLPLGEDNALNAAVGYGLNGRANLTVIADYVWHHRLEDDGKVGEFSLYYGPGARLELSKDPRFGPRVALGIDYRPETLPVQYLLEVGPGLDIIPSTQPFATLSLGVRYFF